MQVFIVYVTSLSTPWYQCNEPREVDICSSVTHAPKSYECVSLKRWVEFYVFTSAEFVWTRDRLGTESTDGSHLASSVGLGNIHVLVTLGYYFALLQCICKQQIAQLILFTRLPLSDSSPTAYSARLLPMLFFFLLSSLTCKKGNVNKSWGCGAHTHQYLQFSPKIGLWRCLKFEFYWFITHSRFLLIINLGQYHWVFIGNLSEFRNT